MKIILTADDAIRLEPTPGPLTIEAASAEMQYSPFHMLASGLASCTFSVLHSWAAHARLPVDDLTLEVQWRFADDPHRVSEIAVRFDWPSLPAARVAAAKRVAALCTVHATLSHPPAIEVVAAAAAGPVADPAAAAAGAAAASDPATLVASAAADGTPA